MAGTIRVNTDQVAQIATSIENLNKQLRQQLDTSKTTINNLANFWEGEAARVTISNYNSFATKYFETYEEVIQNYVKFLRTNVVAGYFQTESANVTLAEAFK